MKKLSTIKKQLDASLHREVTHAERIRELQAKASKEREKRNALRVQLHRDCPRCKGEGWVQVPRQYENGRDTVPCEYQDEWLTGEKPAPEDWWKYCGRW